MCVWVYPGADDNCQTLQQQHAALQHCSTAAGWSKLPPIITASEEWRHTSWSWSHKVALTCTDLIWAHIYSFRQANIHLKLRHLGYKTTKIANFE